MPLCERNQSSDPTGGELEYWPLIGRCPSRDVWNETDNKVTTIITSSNDCERRSFEPILPSKSTHLDKNRIDQMDFSVGVMWFLGRLKKIVVWCDPVMGRHMCLCLELGCVGGGRSTRRYLTVLHHLKNNHFRPAFNHGSILLHCRSSTQSLAWAKA